ncbi:Aminoacyl-tRNA synthetase, class Ia [Dillenia turbinata]|uniref:Aminoacyl-tRNA synthetase, class Ia n=1 Tax=Dillenia turbinata TaxID=194707 RepID=A0AAN8ZD75_9MAGN
MKFVKFVPANMDEVCEGKEFSFPKEEVKILAYWNQINAFHSASGRHVTRRVGWDCHGLPMEFEIDRKLGIKTRQEVIAMVIVKYNEEFRGMVTRYVAEWEKSMTRTG